jgi:hypothetical protein
VKKQDEDFINQVLGLTVAYLAFRWLRRVAGIPVHDPAANTEERLSDTLGELNQKEVREGRRPFVLMRR